MKIDLGNVAVLCEIILAKAEKASTIKKPIDADYYWSISAKVDRWTALAHAFVLGKKECVDFLITKGADERELDCWKKDLVQGSKSNAER